MRYYYLPKRETQSHTYLRREAIMPTGDRYLITIYHGYDGDTGFGTRG